MDRSSNVKADGSARRARLWQLELPCWQRGLPLSCATTRFRACVSVTEMAGAGETMAGHARRPQQ